MSDHTEIIIVLDRSGSMQRIKKDMEGGLDNFFSEQRKEPGTASVTLTQFDNKYEVVYSGKDLKEVPKVKITPRGSTALFDAIGRTIHLTNGRLGNWTVPKGERPRIIFLIITDGYENSSKEFTVRDVRELVKEKTEEDWLFVYLAADQDAITEAKNYGIKTAQSFRADSAGTDQLTRGMSRGVSRYRRGGGYN